MPIMTLEIDGRAIAVTEGEEKEARELLESIADELVDLESDGEVIWDGESPLVVRPATEEEAEAYSEAEVDEEDEDEAAGDDEPVVVFLIDVEGLEGDEDDDEA